MGGKATRIPLFLEKGVASLRAGKADLFCACAASLRSSPTDEARLRGFSCFFL